jgi:hypothetical protein
MLLELAEAYTTSINSGKVPNIQNAWTYVCQNECQRAIDESVGYYRVKMQPVIDEAKTKMDEKILKLGGRQLRELSV